MRFVREGVCIVAIAVTTLGIKAFALNRAEPQETTAAYLRGLDAGLRSEGFATRPYMANSILATRGPCVLRARPFSPYGFSRASIESKGARIGPTQYAYEGRWRNDPPKIKPLTIFYVQRELARLGIVFDVPGITAVSVSRGCRELPVRWTDLTIRLQ